MADVAARSRSNSRRDDILDSFVRHVAERGYDNANLSDIAAELGISKGTIVHHFTTKDRILAEAHEIYMRRRLAELRLIIAALRTPSERVSGIVCALLEYQHHDRSATVTAQREATRFRDSDEMRDVEQMRDDYLALIIGVIESGIEDGSFRAVDPWTTAVTIMSFGQWAWTWYEPQRSNGAEAITAHVNDLLQGGLTNSNVEAPSTDDFHAHIAPLVREIITAS